MKAPTNHLLTKLMVVTIAILAVSCNAHATNGIFVSLDSGVATQSGLPSTSEANAISLDTNLTPPVLRLALGYNHDITSYFGLGMEAGYGEYGKSVYQLVDGGSNTVKSQALEFLALLTFHVQKIDLIGKIGGAREQTDVTGENAPDTSHRNNPELGIEAAYNFSPRFAATLTYAHVTGGTSDKISDISYNSASLDEYLVGLRYTFAS